MLLAELAIHYHFILFCYISMIEVSAVENCPNAKYPINEPLDENVKFYCWEQTEDPCLYNAKYEEYHDAPVELKFTAPQDVNRLFYKVSLTGKNIDARAKGEAKAEDRVFWVDEEGEFVSQVSKGTDVEVYLKPKIENGCGKTPVGENGTVTVNLYFNYYKQDEPDICVRTNLTIVSEED